MAGRYIQFMYTDTFVDQTDPQNMVRHYLKTEYYRTVDPSIQKISDFYVRNVTIEGKQTLLGQSQTFNSFAVDSHPFEEYRVINEWDDDTMFMEINLRQHDSMTLYKKLEYDYLTWAAEVGGISKSFFAVFGGIALFFSRVLFRNLILSSLFMDSQSRYVEDGDENSGTQKSKDENKPKRRIKDYWLD